MLYVNLQDIIFYFANYGKEVSLPTIQLIFLILPCFSLKSEPSKYFLMDSTEKHLVWFLWTCTNYLFKIQQFNNTIIPRDYSNKNWILSAKKFLSHFLFLADFPIYFVETNQYICSRRVIYFIFVFIW